MWLEADSVVSTHPSEGEIRTKNYQMSEHGRRRVHEPWLPVELPEHVRPVGAVSCPTVTLKDSEATALTRDASFLWVDGPLLFSAPNGTQRKKKEG